MGSEAKITVWISWFLPSHHVEHVHKKASFRYVCANCGGSLALEVRPLRTGALTTNLRSPHFLLAWFLTVFQNRVHFTSSSFWGFPLPAEVACYGGFRTSSDNNLLFASSFSEMTDNGRKSDTFKIYLVLTALRHLTCQQSNY